jgi:hypothetical protein
MSTISFDQIPTDMKTQLNNMLAQMKKKKDIISYMITYTHQEVSCNYPQSFKSICEVSLLIQDKSPYKLRIPSEVFSKKADADRQSAFLCYHQVLYYIKNQSDIGLVSSEERCNNFSPVEKEPQQPVPYKEQPNQIYPLLPVITPNPDFNFALYILMDIENKPNTNPIDCLASKYANVLPLKFVGINHPNRKKGNIIVKSSYKDAADHAISLYIGGIIQSVNIPTDIIIYTGDRFASALQEFCNYDNINVYHMAHSEDVIEHMNQHKVISTTLGNVLVE